MFRAKADAEGPSLASGPQGVRPRRRCAGLPGGEEGRAFSAQGTEAPGCKLGLRAAGPPGGRGSSLKTTR